MNMNMFIAELQKVKLHQSTDVQRTMVGLVLVLFLSFGLVDCDPGEPVVIGSPERFRATVGDDVILHCHLKPPLDVTNMFVEWRHEDKMVHGYRNRTEDPELQNERFRGRTSLFHHEMTRGNISLKLTRVTEEDSGEFTCFVREQGKGQVSLDVGKSTIVISFLLLVVLPLFGLLAMILIIWVDRRTDPQRKGQKMIRQSSKQSTVDSDSEKPLAEAQP